MRVEYKDVIICNIHERRQIYNGLGYNNMSSWLVRYCNININCYNIQMLC